MLNQENFEKQTKCLYLWELWSGALQRVTNYWNSKHHRDFLFFMHISLFCITAPLVLFYTLEMHSMQPRLCFLQSKINVPVQNQHCLNHVEEIYNVRIFWTRDLPLETNGTKEKLDQVHDPEQLHSICSATKDSCSFSFFSSIVSSTQIGPNVCHPIIRKVDSIQWTSYEAQKIYVCWQNQKYKNYIFWEDPTAEIKTRANLGLIFASIWIFFWIYTFLGFYLTSMIEVDNSIHPIVAFVNIGLFLTLWFHFSCFFYQFE